MNILRSEGHNIYGMHVNKISLSAFDSKPWIADDGIRTKAYGYSSQQQQFEEITDELLDELADIDFSALEFMGIG